MLPFGTPLTRLSDYPGSPDFGNPFIEPVFEPGSPQKESEMKKIICLDFDGVLHSYKSGWMGAEIVVDPPVVGAMKALMTYLDEGYEIHIFSSRTGQSGGLDAMRFWLRGNLEKHLRKNGRRRDADRVREIVNHEINWPREKPAAHITIDDRGYQFAGTFPTIAEIEEFVPYREADEEAA